MDVTQPKTTVLVIDDDLFTRTLVKADLTYYGFLVETAQSSQEAFERISEKGAGFDVIVSDLRMPGESGLELLAKLRAKGIKTPFFLMSGDELLSEAVTIENGGSGIMRKPFRTGRLTVKIALCLFRERQTA